MKLTKGTVVQREDQELEMKLTKDTFVQIEDPEPEIKLTKDIDVKIEDEEPKDKLALCIPSYKGKLIPFHLHENLICGLCKSWEEHINKF